MVAYKGAAGCYVLVTSIIVSEQWVSTEMRSSRNMPGMVTRSRLYNFDGLVQDCGISIALAMEIPQ